MRWVCACDCGKTTEVASGELRKGSTVSCGCFRLVFGRSNAAALQGRVFGRLSVLERVGSAGRRGALWRCRCSCGKAAEALAADLTGGRVISCGCAAIDKPGLTPVGVLARRAASNHTRRARYRAAPGSFTAAQVDALYLSQRGRCACCGVKLNGVFHRDHRTALANGGTNHIGNIELLCGPCNQRKSAKDEIAWAAENGRLL
jgi:5-methylcytosine-specific restriction endonuclease McrA